MTRLSSSAATVLASLIWAVVAEKVMARSTAATDQAVRAVHQKEKTEASSSG